MNAFNFCTMTEYTGRNAGLAGNGELPAFATFNQLKSQGFMVKKGAKSIPIFCGFQPRTKDKDGKPLEKPVNGIRYARVFDIVDTTAAENVDFMAWLKEEVSAKRIASFERATA
jgi:hypothetical protein